MDQQSNLRRNEPLGLLQFSGSLPRTVIGTDYSDSADAIRSPPKSMIPSVFPPSWAVVDCRRFQVCRTLGKTTPSA